MKVLHVNVSDKIGGASIAMHRLHHALIEQGVDSQLLVRNLSDTKLANEPNVHQMETGWRQTLLKLKYRLATRMAGMQRDPTSFFSSINFFPNRLLSRINAVSPDIVNLHWVGAEIMQIEDLPRIKAPVIWTLSDMWACCGAEHYALSDRFEQGYTPSSRSPFASGVDWNRMVWQRKKRSWRNVAITTVSPSTWLRDCMLRSALWRQATDCEHITIPCALDTDVFQPRDKDACRQRHRLPGDSPIILFGADNVASPMKGIEWLVEAIRNLKKGSTPFRLVCFGNGSKAFSERMAEETAVTALGLISRPLELAEIYCAADVMVVPSRLEAFGQTASEAQASGLPVVCFDTSGLKDIVTHKKTGYRAQCYSPESLAKGIQWCIERASRRSMLADCAAKTALSKFRDSDVARRYVELYRSILGRH